LLDRQTIVNEALSLVRSDGLDGFTIRALALRLKIKGATIYHHFANKQELLDYMTEQLLRDAWVPVSADQSWQIWLRQGAIRTRKTMLAYQDGALMTAGSHPTEVFGTQAIAMLLAPLVGAGFHRQSALYAIFTVIRFTLGWTLDEQEARHHRPRSVAVRKEEGFVFGLDVVVSGLEQKLSGELARK
jgi:TetR/AcrR family transcriptional regulator, tetracycline repressor protein